MRSVGDCRRPASRCDLSVNEMWLVVFGESDDERQLGREVRAMLAHNPGTQHECGGSVYVRHFCSVCSLSAEAVRVKRMRMRSVASRHDACPS